MSNELTNNDVTPASEYLTVKEAAAFLGVSEPTLRKAMTEGKVPFIELGPKTIRIPRDGIRDLWERAEATA